MSNTQSTIGERRGLCQWKTRYRYCRCSGLEGCKSRSNRFHNEKRHTPIYNTICAKCHGKDGLSPKGMKPLGAQMGNPWEVMHKILNGEPDSETPALRALPYQVTADIMAYVTGLPAKRR